MIIEVLSGVFGFPLSPGESKNGELSLPRAVFPSKENGGLQIQKSHSEFGGSAGTVENLQKTTGFDRGRSRGGEKYGVESS